jgi:hypothetical protein
VVFHHEDTGSYPTDQKQCVVTTALTYAAHRRRAILAATVLDLETRLTYAVLDIADKLVGGFFAKARNATRQRYVASATTVGRLMHLFHGTIDALAAAQEGKTEAFEFRRLRRFHFLRRTATVLSVLEAA